jgi:hypothetical protein
MMERSRACHLEVDAHAGGDLQHPALNDLGAVVVGVRDNMERCDAWGIAHAVLDEHILRCMSNATNFM